MGVASSLWLETSGHRPDTTTTAPRKQQEGELGLEESSRYQNQFVMVDLLMPLKTAQSESMITFTFLS